MALQCLQEFANRSQWSVAAVAQHSPTQRKTEWLERFVNFASDTDAHLEMCALGTVEQILSCDGSGSLGDVETDFGRFELLINDNKKSVHPVVIADDIKKNSGLAMIDHVEFKQNTLSA